MRFFTPLSAALLGSGAVNSLLNHRLALSQTLTNEQLLQLTAEVQAQGIIHMTEGSGALVIGGVTFTIAALIALGLCFTAKNTESAQAIALPFIFVCGTTAAIATGWGFFKLGEGAADVAQAVIANSGLTLSI